MKQLSNLKQFAFYLLISLFLTACGEQDKTASEPVKTKEVLTLNGKNISSFTKSFSKEYFSTLDNLVNSFETARDSGKEYEFVKYRNQTWTPNFKERKDYYEAILKKNNAFIKKVGIKPLFEKFSGMLYVGVYLKNGLLDGDKEKLEKAFSIIEKDKKVVKALSK